MQFLAFICFFYILDMLTVKDRLDQNKVMMLQAVSRPKNYGVISRD